MFLIVSCHESHKSMWLQETDVRRSNSAWLSNSASQIPTAYGGGGRGGATAILNVQSVNTPRNHRARNH